MSGGNQTRDAKMCVVAQRLLHVANERNRGAIAGECKHRYWERNSAGP